MASQKINFKNKEGYQLAGRLEMPVGQHPHSFALFAHCFTCNKNLSAVRNIGRTLNQSGVAVLRFDFAGLAESEGDFENTNFSSNVGDLLAAAEYLEENYKAPVLLIGHSLGGAAVINVVDQLPSIKAVVTIGAPYSPAHVSHLFDNSKAEIEQYGKAEVSIGGRSFTVKKQFLDDISSTQQQDKIQKLRRALLVLHSPQDTTVEVANAGKIYKAAHHPKSFISLDGADHLLSNKDDSNYVGNVIGHWVKRYLDIPARPKLTSNNEVVVRLGDEGFTSEVMVRHHGLIADEPIGVGGNDFGPSPYELLSASLGACTAMTLQMYARRKKWDLKEVRVHLDHRKDYTTDLAETGKSSKIDYFDRLIEMDGDLDEKQIKRLLEIADRCPVHRTLHSDIKVVTRLKR